MYLVRCIGTNLKSNGLPAVTVLNVDSIVRNHDACIADLKFDPIVFGFGVEDEHASKLVGGEDLEELGDELRRRNNWRSSDGRSVWITCHTARGPAQHEAER